MVAVAETGVAGRDHVLSRPVPPGARMFCAGTGPDRDAPPLFGRPPLRLGRLAPPVMGFNLRDIAEGSRHEEAWTGGFTGKGSS